jgi:capsular exopolysaccharide synthesis family protein
MSQLARALRKAHNHSDTPELPDGQSAPPWEFALLHDDVAASHVKAPAVLARGPAVVADSAHPAARQQAVSAARLRLNIDRETAPKLAVGSSARPEIRHQFRKMAASLHELPARREVRVVMIASAVPEEGKTLTAINLALTLHDCYQCRVLLVDADLRRPAIHRVLGCPNSLGLGDCASRRDTDPLPSVEILNGLSVLPAGRGAGARADQLVSGVLESVIAAARPGFQWVVIDTPPIAFLPDAKLIAEISDAVVLVVRAGSTASRLAQRAIQSLGRERIVGVVLNQVASPIPSYSHGYYEDGESRR